MCARTPARSDAAHVPSFACRTKVLAAFILQADIRLRHAWFNKVMEWTDTSRFNRLPILLETGLTNRGIA